MKEFARSYALRRKANIHYPHAASQSYEPGRLPLAYGWPTGIAVSPLSIVIGELGGAVYQSDIPAWAARAGLPAPTVTSRLLAGADNSPSDADGEVALDWQRAAEVYSFMTGLPANIVLIYGPNSGQAFADVMNVSPTGVGAGSWSWGSPESNWSSQERAAFDTAAQKSPFPWFAASGDNDANDGTNAPITDFPSASPLCTGCGGTSRPPTGPETVWNNGNSEGTGGGFSKLYATPLWQTPNAQGTGRMVPDFAAVADPQTGYDCLVNGQWGVIGGTSAVAPLMAGFMTVVNGARLKLGMPMISGPQLNALLWTLPGSFFDVISGNNGAYNATIGPDPCTGMGRALGTLFASLTGNHVPPNPPTPPVPPTPIPPVPGPSLFTLNINRPVRKGGLVYFYAPVAIPAGAYAFTPVSGAKASNEASDVTEAKVSDA